MKIIVTSNYQQHFAKKEKVRSYGLQDLLRDRPDALDNIMSYLDVFFPEGGVLTSDNALNSAKDLEVAPSHVMEVARSMGFNTQEE